MKFSKLTLIAVCLALSPVTVFAQKPLGQRIAEDFCKELEKQNISDVWNESTMEKISLAMMPVATKYAEEYEKEYKVELKTQKDFEDFGNVIGEEAAKYCPKFKKIMESMMASKVEEVKSTTTLEGTFTGLDTSGSFAFFKVKGADGREQKIWWFEHFNGSELLTAALNNKKVTAVFVEREVYEPKLKDYVKIKVAAGLKTN